MAVEEQKIPKEIIPKLEKFREALRKGIEKEALPILLPQEILKRISGVEIREIQEILEMVFQGLFSTAHLIKFLEEIKKIKERDIRSSHEFLSAIFAAALTNFENQEEPIRRIGEEIGAEEVMKNIENIIKEKGEIPEEAKKTLEEMGVRTVDDSYRIVARQNLYATLLKILESFEGDEVAKLLNEFLERGEDEKYLIVKKTFEHVAKKLGIDAKDVYEVKDGKVKENPEIVSKVREKLLKKIMEGIKELEEYKKWKEVIDFYKSL